MKNLFSSVSWPTRVALNRLLFQSAKRLRGSAFLVALLGFLLPAWQTRATGFFDGFESYNTGALDKNLVGGPNAAPNGTGNPWFGPNPANLRVVTAEYSVTPHSGSKMIRGLYNARDNDQDWYNLVWRCNPTHTVYYGNIVLDWWFYDPAGTGANKSMYCDYLALVQYANVPSDTDTNAAGMPAYVAGGQRMCLGALGYPLGTAGDNNKYQARIVGATDGANANGWFNVNRTRSVGWHHARMVVSDPNGANTMAYFYIDDMVTPLLSHIITTTTGFNAIEINADMGGATGSIVSGWFDDFCFVDNASKPTIATGPASLLLRAGSNATFSVTGATGSPSPAYYWLRNTVPLTNSGNISGADTPTLTLTNITSADVGTYSVIVSNIAGAATASATLTFPTPPVVDSQSPTCGVLYVSLGSPVNFSASGHATYPLNYQWQVNKGSGATNIIGATGTTFSIPATVASDSGSYSCNLSNEDGQTNTCPVVLVVTTCPSINGQPHSLAVGLGTNAAFSVDVAGTDLQFTWKRDGTTLHDGDLAGRVSGATTATLTIASALDSDNGTTYTCGITNSCGGVITDPVTLTVVDPPIITSQPSPATYTTVATSNAAFHVVAVGTSASFQWKRNGAPVANGGRVSGATSPDLVFASTFFTDAGTYTVTISNLAGVVTSAPAVLNLTQPEYSWLETFEGYKLGRLGYNESGPNTDPPDPWFGHYPPNGQVVNTERYTVGYLQNAGPRSGTNMVRAADASLGDNNRLNIPYRINARGRLYGNFKLDWLFYDPAGNNLAFSDFMGIGNFNLPLDRDFSGAPGGPVIWLGAYCGSGSGIAGLDPAFYQARIAGQTDGAAGDIYNTAKVRSVGWHHGRMLFGPPNGTNTLVSLYIDDMVNPLVTHAIGSSFSAGFDVIDLNFRWHQLTSDPSGYFDDVSIQVLNDSWIAVQPVSQAVLAYQPASFQVVANAGSYQWKKNGSVISDATDSVYTIPSAAAGDEGSYSCVVTGAKGSVESAVARLVLMDSTRFGAGTGLRGQYFNNTTLDPAGLDTDRTDSQVLFDGGPSGSPPPGTGLGAQNFSIRWTGMVQPAYSGNYTFCTRTDDGVRLWVNGQLVVNHWVGQPPTEWWSAGIPLEAGQYYPIKMEFYQGSGGDFYSLSWATDTVNKDLIPMASLYPYPDPYIITQPADQIVDPAATATFTVSAIGSAPFTYQWLREGTPIPGATGPSYSLNNVQPANAFYAYSVVVSNGFGASIASSSAMLLVNGPLVVTEGPQNLTVALGQPATFKMRVSGTPASPLPPYYTFWWYNCADPSTILEYGGSSFTIPNAQYSDAGSYNAYVYNNTDQAANVPCGRLTVVEGFPVKITDGPKDQTVFAGANVTFNVTATGIPAPTYQWRKNGADLPDQTNSSLLLPAVQLADSGTYSVVAANTVSNVLYSVTTNAVLQVNPVTVQWSFSAGNGLSLSWPAGFVLQNSFEAQGPYHDVPGATSPFVTNTLSNPRLFFRLRSGS